ncbi:MAG TPA: 50S ribosomal protein L3 N(5)-glutamine methyltransferase [Usitatibacter sp.]|nr:50S ribosomal protein L3 N(5)-glutamine methyltransferase [Usitatibacter sp.]
MKTIREVLFDAAGRFDEAGLVYGHGTTNALDEAAWLVLHAAGLPPLGVKKHLSRELTPEELRTARDLIARRIRSRKPAAYLLNEAWLGPHKFYVDERVIVPRSFIAEMLRKRGLSPKSVLDLCTGSGCLAIVAALQFREARLDAADISDAALEVAKRNVAEYGLGDRVGLVKSDLFSALEGRKYDLIISNPPYVKASSMKKLPDEYRKEPVLALASGADGLEHTRRILAHARDHLAPGGRLVVEIGHNRKALEKSFPKLPFRWPRVSAGTGFVFMLERESLP